ncbi:MAG: cell division protein ZapA [Deltaproteobacteria bacterium]|nr:cell division protein ZapA [Deltaproteobacteria bacterium]
MRSRDRAPSERTHLERSRAADVRSASSSARTVEAARTTTTATRGDNGARRRVDVSVMGLSLSVRTDREDAWVHGLAGQVNRRLDELKRTAKNASPQQLAVLVALNLAEELHTERQRAEGREHELEGQLEALAIGALARVREALTALGDGGDRDHAAEDDDSAPDRDDDDPRR